MSPGVSALFGSNVAGIIMSSSQQLEEEFGEKCPDFIDFIDQE